MSNRSGTKIQIGFPCVLETVVHVNDGNKAVVIGTKDRAPRRPRPQVYGIIGQGRDRSRDIRDDFVGGFDEAVQQHVVEHGLLDSSERGSAEKRAYFFNQA